MNKRGTLFTIFAPSGAGKTSLVKALVQQDASIVVSVSHTTRERRSGEEQGIHYNFVSSDTFLELLGNGQFLESAQVFGNYYGTSQQWVEKTLAGGTDVILEIDWQGVEQVQRQMPGVVAICILPPSLHALNERLAFRGQDDAAVINARMEEAISEISNFHRADYLVVNDNFSVALNQVQSIVASYRLRREYQEEKHRALLQELLSKPL